ncbi:unnamed protein product [Thelazia callipaeda]|uniref:Tudor domain-containing protein n=1 Tax=Thelazia callipaeda TaxID=103827 RepID=A0A0N5CVH7_THECL|nr:unnamed protein product [Thelazia callipaeda]
MNDTHGTNKAEEKIVAKQVQNQKEECCVVVQSGYQKYEKKIEGERRKTASGIIVENNEKADEVLQDSWPGEVRKPVLDRFGKMSRVGCVVPCVTSSSLVSLRTEDVYLDVKEKYRVLIYQKAQGREIDQTKWTRKIISEKVDPLILEAAVPSSTTMLRRDDKAWKEAIDVESKHKKEDK